MKIKLTALIIVLIAIMSWFPALPASASSVKYVSAETGSDDGNGTQARPYRTISKAKENMAAADTIIVDSGVYNESIVFVEANGSDDARFTIKGAPDADVRLSAYDPVNSEWSEYKNGIFRTSVGIRDDISHAVRFYNDRYTNLVEARWPNAEPNDLLGMERAKMGEGSNHYGICDPNLPQGDFNGATVYLWTGKEYEQYVSYARIVTDYISGKSLKFSSYAGESSDTYTPQKNNWYYLTNSLYALDYPGEYYYEKSTGFLYVVTENGEAPQPGEIQIKTRANAVELWSCSYISLENINIIGGGVTVHDTDNCSFDGVNVYYSDFFRTNDGYNTHINAYNSTRLCGNFNTWKNSEIAYTMSSGILINGDNNSVINCDIHDVAIGGGYNAAISIEGDAASTTIAHNDLYRSGRFLIYFINTGVAGNGYPNTLIEYNDCSGAMYLTRDGGAIYAYHRLGSGVTIRNNWVHDCKNSCGIYLDNECKGFTVRNNVVWNVEQSGIVINNSSLDNLIYRNTVFDCGEGIQGWPKTAGYSQKGTVVCNNAINPTADFITGENAPTLISNVFAGEFDLSVSFVPNQHSPLIDKGSVLDGIADEYTGSAPDVGAYEANSWYWIPGLYQNTLAGDADFDGRLNVKDVLNLRKKIAGLEVTTDKFAADVNADGKLNGKDTLLIRRYLAGYDIQFLRYT